MKRMMLEMQAAMLAYFAVESMICDEAGTAWFFYAWLGITVYRWCRVGSREGFK